MVEIPDQHIEQGRQWVFALSASQVGINESRMVRLAGRQIAVFNTIQGFRACDNRCPHEGFPLSQGSLCEKSILTCNWHNWKFNLADGSNLFGGDRLRIYPVQQRGDELWIDLTDPPHRERRADLEMSLRAAFDDHSYDRISREIARLIKLGDDPLDVLRLAIDWSWQRLEFGWTHAYAGMADWLTLYDEYGHDRELQLVCLLEAVGHIAFDVLRESDYPYSEQLTSFDKANFLLAIEHENQSEAIALIRGGLRDGLQFEDFEQALSEAALAHYNDFGHSLIYITKAKQLIQRLGPQVTEALMLSLVRGICYATREDKIPEFAAYARSLNTWGKHNGATPTAAHWLKLGIDRALDATVAVSQHDPLAIYESLLEVNALNLLGFDIAQQDKTDISISGNVGWLDFTHAITFANAVRKQCTLFPELWPRGLLQLACFSGRNSAFTTVQSDLEHWVSKDIAVALKEILEGLFDHGQAEYIVSVHWLKLTLAVRQEVASLPQHQGEILTAALSRFIHSPLKLKQAKRTAHQSLMFVAKE